MLSSRKPPSCRSAPWQPAHELRNSGEIFVSKFVCGDVSGWASTLVPINSRYPVVIVFWMRETELQALFYLGYSYLGVLAAIEGYQSMVAGSQGVESYL